MMVIYEDSVEEEIFSLKNENTRMTLSDLLSLVTEAERLYSELHCDLVKLHFIDNPELLSTFHEQDLTGLIDTRGK